MNAPIPTVLDTDPGIDDALALLLAWGSPELDVLALTVVAGNAPLADTARNAARLVAVRRPAREPLIALGAAVPLCRIGRPWPARPPRRRRPRHSWPWLGPTPSD